MAQTGYTPIQLYYSTTSTNVPSNANLLPGELGFNIHSADFSLYAENSAGTVTRLMNNPAGLKYPTSDGTSGQFMTTNGAGVLSFGTAATATNTLTLTNKTITYADNTLTGVQASLVSGTNIKTVNSNSLVGSGDVVVGAIPTVVVLTTSTTWVVPAGVTKIKATVVGGGGGGNADSASGMTCGGGGGGTVISWETVTPGMSFTVVVGAGGAGASTDPGNGTVGGTSSIDNGAGIQLIASGGAGAAGTVTGGGAAANGDINIPGGAATSGGSHSPYHYMPGGASCFAMPTAYGSAGTGYGGGGGSALLGGTTGFAGSAGVVIFEY